MLDVIFSLLDCLFNRLKEITESTNIDKHLEENIVSAFEIDKVNEVVAKDAKEEPDDKVYTLLEFFILCHCGAYSHLYLIIVYFLSLLV